MLLPSPPATEDNFSWFLLSNSAISMTSKIAETKLLLEMDNEHKNYTPS